jgi:16S rRNA (adenine1518-N6/adenine1519-N6)-dimethyltransferase
LKGKLIAQASKQRHHPLERSLLSQTRQSLHRLDLKARKGLGQHFLIDGKVLELITKAAELNPQDIVIEVGPGLGILTKELVKLAGWVITVELDAKLASVLRHNLAPFSNISIINNDILQVEPEKLIREHEGQFPVNLLDTYHYKVVANLPYYITSPTLHHILQASVKPQTIVVMIQKEVAKAITAQPGQMSPLSVSIQFYGRPRIVGLVPARCFYPTPKVDSAVLRIDIHPEPPAAVTDAGSFLSLVYAGFAASRKQLANSLAQGLKIDKSNVLPLLESAEIMPQRRPGSLSMAEWVKLWLVFSEVEKKC